MEEVWKRINASIDALQKKAATDELDASICDDLMALREVFKDEVKDPLATKLCRLSAEHIAAEGRFDFDINDEDEGIDMTSLQYLLEILRDPANKYNREEMTAYKHALNEVRQY